jgi:hypothetical protein
MRVRTRRWGWTTVINHLAYTIIVNNGGSSDGAGGTVTAQKRTWGPYLNGINCGLAQADCSGKVLSGSTVVLTFKPQTGSKTGNVESTDTACTVSFPGGHPPGGTVSCTVTASGGKTISVTPHWQ